MFQFNSWQLSLGLGYRLLLLKPSIHGTQSGGPAGFLKAPSAGSASLASLLLRGAMLLGDTDESPSAPGLPSLPSLPGCTCPALQSEKALTPNSSPLTYTPRSAARTRSPALPVLRVMMLTWGSSTAWCHEFRVPVYTICSCFLRLSSQWVITTWNGLNCVSFPPHFKFSSPKLWHLQIGPLWEVGSLQTCVCVRVKSFQLCPTLCDSMECSPLGSSVRGILQARILVWEAICFPRGSSQPRDGSHMSYVTCIARWVLYH